MADSKVLKEQLKLLIENPDAFGEDESSKQELLKLSRVAAATLESPFETIQRLVYSPLPLVAARICQDRSIFETLAASKDGVDLATLAQASGLGPGVLESIMDYICVQNMAEELSRGRYAATKLTNILLAPVFTDAVTHFHDNCLPGFTALHRTLTSDDGKSLTAFQRGQNTPEDFYTWQETRPVQRDAFHRFMDAQFSSLPTWLDVVPFESEIAKGATSTDVAFVDVGGGNGSQCAVLKKSVPGLAGRLILQDKPYVLQKALEVDGMEKMAYDFLTEQPVKGARAYYFRQIMHNHDDTTCIRILKSQIPAMGPESVIILDDKVLPDEKPPAGTPGVEYTAALSIAMKVMFDAQERREGHWRQLLDEAGLEIKDIRKFTKFDDAVVIAVVKKI